MWVLINPFVLQLIFKLRFKRVLWNVVKIVMFLKIFSNIKPMLSLWWRKSKQIKSESILWHLTLMVVFFRTVSENVIRRPSVVRKISKLNTNIWGWQYFLFFLHQQKKLSSNIVKVCCFVCYHFKFLCLFDGHNAQNELKLYLTIFVISFKLFNIVSKTFSLQHKWITTFLSE